MDLAARTTASPTAIWVIVVVAVVLLAFWLAMVMVYANRPDPRFRQLGVAQVPTQRGPAVEPTAAAGSAVTSGETVTEPVPAQRAAPSGAPADTERPASRR